MKKDLLFYNEYEQIYRFAEESEAFKEFYNEASLSFVGKREEKIS